MERTVASHRIEHISFRHCRACRTKWPAYMDTCNKCAASLDDPFVESFEIITPDIHDESRLPTQVLQVATLAIELTVPEWMRHDEMRSRASEILLRDVKASADRFVILPTGNLVVIFAKKTLFASLICATDLAEIIQSSCRDREWETRVGIAHGLTYGPRVDESLAVLTAEKFARAAQAGETLTTLAISKTLKDRWDFAPAGIVPRRKEDKVENCILLKGRKMPVPTPSALRPDDGRSIIGRDTELSLMSSELKKTIQREETRWLVIVAPAGGGKSKLIRSWLASCKNNTESIRVLGSNASPFGAQRFSVINDLLRGLGHEKFIGSSPYEASRRLERALRKANLNYSTIVVIEDLHWADQDSLLTLKLLKKSDLRSCLVIAAMRTSFAESASWLNVGKTVFLHLPGLNLHETNSLLHVLLPEPEFREVATILCRMPQASNPLYLEQCSAYLRESDQKEHLPRSLHEAVLDRLKMLSKSINESSRMRYEFDLKGSIDRIEREVCEWLDRLETGDYEGRKALAGYLGILQNIDTQLIILKSIHGRPILRNRRLVAAIDRFYSASFFENVEAIKDLSNMSRSNAAYASQRAAYRAEEDLRIRDLIGYLTLEEQYTEDDHSRAEVLIELGDALVWAGCLDDANDAYSVAQKYSIKDPLLSAICLQRIGHFALLAGSWKRAAEILEIVLDDAKMGERFTTECDYALAIAQLGKRSESLKRMQTIFSQIEAGNRVLPSKMLHYWLKTKIQIERSKINGKFESGLVDDNELLGKFANSFVFEKGTLAELSNYVSSLKLIETASDRQIGSGLRNEIRNFQKLLECRGQRVSR